MAWIKQWLEPSIRAGDEGRLILPGERNGITCCALWENEELQAIEWFFDDEKDFVWRTQPFTEDLIYVYTYQKTKQETLDFLQSINARKIKVANSGKSNRELLLERIHSLVDEKGIYFVAGFILVVVSGDFDG